MKYQLFGRSGLRVSELCIGTMTFGKGQVSFGQYNWGAGVEDKESLALLETFADAGGNFIDTANLYMDGASERLVGEFIHSDRDHFVVSTKYTPSNGSDLVRAGNNRKNMMRCIDESLRRLNTDHVDVYWLHFWDSTTPLDELMRGLDDLVSAGKVLYVAVSDTPAWQISRANMLADLRGWNPFIGIQVEYSLIQRTPERDLLPMAKELSLGITAFAALARGVLSGKYLHPPSSSASATADASTLIPERQSKIAQTVVDIALDYGCTPSQVALAAVRQQTRFGPIIPILGVRTAAQLQDNLGCLNVVLEERHIAQLNEVSQIELGFPHEMLNSEVIRGLATANQFNRLECRR